MAKTVMAITRFTTLAQSATAEFKDKGSRFLAFAYPLTGETEIKPLVQALRDTHHKARHWCFAWRLGVDGNRFRANDDGEPAGSAGLPILGQIDSAHLTDVLVVVVRYFGGVLLGIPGLIRAYKTATYMALAQAEIIEKNLVKTVFLSCDYANLNQALRIVRQFQATIVQQELQQHCCLQIQVPLAQFEACCQTWLKTRKITFTIAD